MTIEMVPATGSPVWREIYPAPKDVRLEKNGMWCPMDTTVALRPQLHGWLCPTCLAWWDVRGRDGRWVTDHRVIDGEVGADLTAEAARLRQLDRALALAITAGVVLGGGYTAGRAMRPHADAVPEALLWAASLILIGLVLIGLGVQAAQRWREARDEQ